MSRAETKNELLDAAKTFFAASFDGIVKLNPDDDAALWVNGFKSPPEISNTAPEKSEPDCVWHGASETLQQALFSVRSFESAYISGRVTVSGDMSVLARIANTEEN